ncbi:toxic anion resistance protein [Agromyces humi]|uniref:toxic anion resistance protein n=1 Tax=Agromyces humi TaxID=1766800 RepID=UPI001357EE86|nr:toxic anion resistance protein [Agromyces humi]
MTLLAPDEEPGTTLVLNVPEPVEDVQPNSAQSMLKPVDDSRKLEIGQQAKGFVTDLVKYNPNSPEFVAKLNDIQTLAKSEVAATGDGASRMLERSTTSVAGAKRNGKDTTTKVVTSLAELRSTVSDLTPNAADLNRGQKFLGLIGGNKVRKYFQRYESAQQQLDGIIKALIAGQDELQKDNASLQLEKQKLWDSMGQLNEYIILADAIDRELVGQVDQLRAAGNVQAAQVMEADMLFTVRQRHQDLLTQLAVAIQGYMAMEMVRKNNVELIKGVDRARTTTITALRTAIIVAEALSNQKLVLDQLDAVKATTEKTILATAEMMRQQTARIHEQAASPALSVETLQRSFDNLFATLDEIETFKTKANANMAQSIGQLSAQLERARPQLDRARALDTAAQQPAISA